MANSVGADELVSNADLHGVAHHRHLDLPAAVLGAGPVAGAGEADWPHLEEIAEPTVLKLSWPGCGRSTTRCA